MEILHRIALTPDELDKDELATCGITARAGFFAFDLSESDERWPAVEAWIARRQPSDVIRTRFTDVEIAAADWLAVLPDWHVGYPQPESGFGYRQVTYDVSDFCEACGVGLRQVNPFRFKREPTWGQRGVLQLNWVFDEYFARPEVWEKVFRPLGVDSDPVLDVQGDVLNTVVQLVNRERVHVDVGGLSVTVCVVCGRSKYQMVTRGYSPSPATHPVLDLARSLEWFGDGAVAANQVIASQSVHRVIQEHRVRGISFAPTLSADVSPAPATRRLGP